MNVRRKRYRSHGLVELRREVTEHYILLINHHQDIVCRDLVCLDFWELGILDSIGLCNSISRMALS